MLDQCSLCRVPTCIAIVSVTRVLADKTARKTGDAWSKNIKISCMGVVIPKNISNNIGNLFSNVVYHVFYGGYYTACVPIRLHCQVFVWCIC